MYSESRKEEVILRSDFASKIPPYSCTLYISDCRCILFSNSPKDKGNITQRKLGDG